MTNKFSAVKAEVDAAVKIAELATKAAMEMQQSQSDESAKLRADAREKLRLIRSEIFAYFDFPGEAGGAKW